MEVELYEKVLKGIKKNRKNKDLNWIKFKKIFKNGGKQGIAGILETDNTDIVFKTSQYINFLVKHEYNILESLNDLRDYCPHFCKSFGVIQHSVDGDYRKSTNPFLVKSKNPIQVDTLLMEYISDLKLFSFIKIIPDNEKEKIIFSQIKQILMAICLSQEKKNFTHYDLHSCNILMKKCDEKDYFLYILDDENQVLIPTYGHYPVIIDPGFGYIKDMENKPFYSTLAHTDVGFMSNQYDPIADLKLFLVTISDDLKRYSNLKSFGIFRNIVRNVFEPLDIDLESGWDKHDKKGAVDYLIDKIKNINIESKLFKKYSVYCIDLMHLLIQLPMQKRSTKNLESSYKLFINEFEKIENEISSSFLNLYIFKNIVETASDVKNLYLTEKGQKEALTIFKERIFNSINTVAKFCIPKNLNYEKLLCGIIIFSQCMEGVLFEVIKDRNQIKDNEYSNLEIKTPMQILAAIEINILDNYHITPDCKIHVWDAKNEKRDNFTLSQELCDNVNDSHPLFRGAVVFKDYKNHQKI